MKNQHEMKIKIAFIKWMLSNTPEDSVRLIINEFTANNSKTRADLAAVIDNNIVAFEFKSQNDKLVRLKNQITNLKKIYNRVEVIVSQNHAKQTHAIAKQFGAGLVVEYPDGFKRVLKGRQRRLDETHLTQRLFPLSVKRLSNFSATEEYYLEFLQKKYSKCITNLETIKKDPEKLSPEKVKSLNTSHIHKIEQNKKKCMYIEELRRSMKKLQSTQSSSNSSLENSCP